MYVKLPQPPFATSSARTLEKDKYEESENQTNDTWPHPLLLDSVTLAVSGVRKKPTKDVFEFVIKF